MVLEVFFFSPTMVQPSLSPLARAAEAVRTESSWVVMGATLNFASSQGVFIIPLSRSLKTAFCWDCNKNGQEKPSKGLQGKKYCLGWWRRRRTMVALSIVLEKESREGT